MFALVLGSAFEPGAPAAEVGQLKSNSASGGSTISSPATGADGTVNVGNQWRTKGSAITVATNASRVLNIVRLSHAGQDGVVVANSLGAATSRAAVQASWNGATNSCGKLTARNPGCGTLRPQAVKSG